LGIEDAVNASARLSYQDVYYIHQIALRDLRFGEWLFDLMLYAKQRKVFLSRLFLSKETLRYEFKNGKEKYLNYLQQCIDADLLFQVGNHCNFNTQFGTFRRPRVFKVNYDFEDTALLPKGVSYRKALTEIFSAKQIRKMFPKSTAWRLNRRDTKWNKDKIKSLRKGLGLTQQQFALKLGVSKRALIYWEKGKRSPSSEIKTKLDDIASEIE
jgi:DNA-binding transcriptional regulator YiaG